MWEPDDALEGVLRIRSSNPYVRAFDRDKLPWPRSVTTIVCTDAFEIFWVMVILLNLILIVCETDARATHKDFGDFAWMTWAGYAFLFGYCVELSLRLYIEREKFFMCSLNLVDLVITIVDLCSLFFNLRFTAIFRVVRLVRLLPILRCSKRFHELWLMLHGLASTIRAMGWACALIAVVLLLVSVVAVEVLQPICMELVEQDGFHGCARCATAFDSVTSAMGTWFLLVFVGDLWTDFAVPLMANRTNTAVVFMSAYVMIQLGLLNLILTVIVDRASQARAENLGQKVLEKQEECKRAQRKLLKLCETMDTDGNHALSLQELENGYDNIPDFAGVLQLMDVSRDDIRMVYEILDMDSDGSVTYGEFVEQLHKMRHAESHTLLCFIKHYVHDVQKKVSEQLLLMKNDLLVRTQDLLDLVAVRMAPSEAQSSSSPLEAWPPPVGFQQVTKLLRTSEASDAGGTGGTFDAAWRAVRAEADASSSSREAKLTNADSIDVEELLRDGEPAPTEASSPSKAKPTRSAELDEVSLWSEVVSPGSCCSVLRTPVRAASCSSAELPSSLFGEKGARSPRALSGGQVVGHRPVSPSRSRLTPPCPRPSGRRGPIGKAGNGSHLPGCKADHGSRPPGGGHPLGAVDDRARDGGQLAPSDAARVWECKIEGMELYSL